MVRDFISEHKRLSVGLILYVTVFVVSIFISPWSLENSGVALTDPGDSAMDNILIHMLLFGIYDLFELFEYSETNSFTGTAFLFFITACAVFGYTKIFQDLVINDECDDIPEKLGLNYLYDNIFTYIVCLVMYYAYIPIAGSIEKKFDEGGFLTHAFIILLIIGLIVIPAIPHFLHFLAYLYAVSAISDWLERIENSLHWPSFFENIVVFLAAAGCMLVLNLIITLLLDGLMNVLKERYFMEAVPEFLLGVFKIVATVAVAFAVILVICLILSAKAKGA